jgi:hypothetical protein
MQSRQILYAMASCFLLTAMLLVGCGGGSSQPGQSGPVQSVIRFSSHPATAANEADLYTYSPTATDTANGTITFAITQAPDGATLSGDTVNWTPTPAQSRVANSFIVTATSSAGGSAQQTWSVTPTGVIHGQQLITWHKDDGAVTTPNDLTSFPINVLIPSSGGYTTLPGTGGADGAFTVSKVPGGTYMLQFYNNYFQTSRGQIDLSFDILGRSDAQLASSMTRQLQVNGMAPWQTNDYFQWYSSNLNDTVDLWPNSAITSGDTVLNLLWGVSGLRMLDASKSDTAYLGQLVPTLVSTPSGSIQIYNLSKIYQVTGLTEIDGQINTVGGGGATFSDVALTDSIEGNIKGASFVAMRSSLNPHGTADRTASYLDVLPYGANAGWFGNTPDLFAYSGPPIMDDEDDGPLPFGNPYDSSWPLALAVQDFVKVDYNVPGLGTVSKRAYSSILSTDMPTVSQPIAPLIGPVTSPQIDGIDFFQDQALNTLTPKISWGPPALGTPNQYVVTLCKWVPGASYMDVCGSDAVTMAVFYTRGTSIVVPSGILESGSRYYFFIRSTSMAGLNLDATPYRLACPAGLAKSLSGMINVTATSKASFRYRSMARVPKSPAKLVAPPPNPKFERD